MPGNTYLLDTNAVVALLQGNQELFEITQSAEWLGLSIISVLEFSGFDKLSEQDHLLLSHLVARVTVIDLAHTNTALISSITQLRQSKALKLPDAIILASAAVNQATLVTNDAQLLKFAGSHPQYAARGFQLNP